MHGGFLYFTLTQLCGLKPSVPGFAKISFSPCFAAMTDHVDASLNLIAGKVSVTIDRRDDGHFCTLTVPAGASCTVRHESAACLRCLWQTSRNQALHARRLAEETDEPLLKTLYTELADLLEEQCEPLQNIVCALIG
jgi:hypothetical protein